MKTSGVVCPSMVKYVMHVIRCVHQRPWAFCTILYVTEKPDSATSLEEPKSGSLQAAQR